jgi:hypothetical protein
MPSKLVEITVRLHIRNTNGYYKTVYIDDAEMSISMYASTTEQFEYYDWDTYSTKSSEIGYGIIANMFSNEVLSGDHTRNQMILSVQALATGTGGLSLKYIELKIEILPIVLEDHGTWWWWWDDYYHNKYDSLDTLGLSSVDSRLGIYESPSNDLVDEFTFYTAKLGYEIVCKSVGSLIGGGPAGGFVAGFFASLTGDFVVSLALGRTEPSEIIEHDAEGQNYENFNRWGFVSKAPAPYPLLGYVYDVPASASAEHFLEWTYKNNVGQRQLRITATFHWCHVDGGGYTSFKLSTDGTTTSVLDI